MKRIERLLPYFSHPFFIGGLAFIYISRFLKSPKEIIFYLLLSCLLLMLPKIIGEFLFARIKARKEGINGLLKTTLYYVAFMISTDVLFFKNHYEIGTAVRIVIVMLLYFGGEYWYYKKPKN
jgi:hypothetical protein